MTVKMTRRDLASVLGSAAAVIAGRAQETPPVPPEDVNSAAKDQMRKNVEAMAKVDLAQSIEPAFLFRP